MQPLAGAAFGVFSLLPFRPPSAHPGSTERSRAGFAQGNDVRAVADPYLRLELLAGATGRTHHACPRPHARAFSDSAARRRARRHRGARIVDRLFADRRRRRGGGLVGAAHLLGAARAPRPAVPAVLSAGGAYALP